MLDKSKLYYVNNNEHDVVKILFEDSISWYVEIVNGAVDAHRNPIRRSCKKTSFELTMVRQHTTAEIINQCIFRWELSDDFTCTELFHYVEAAKTIRDELKAEGY